MCPTADRQHMYTDAIIPQFPVGVHYVLPIAFTHHILKVSVSPSLVPMHYAVCRDCCNGQRASGTHLLCCLVHSHVCRCCEQFVQSSPLFIASLLVSEHRPTHLKSFSLLLEMVVTPKGVGWEPAG